MSIVRNPNSVQGTVHQAFHLVAKKKNLDVDLVAGVYADCQEWIEHNLHRKNAQKLKSKSGGYSKIIQVNVPVRFYWASGEYDGLEFGPFDNLTSYESRLIKEVLEAVQGKIIVTDAYVLCSCGLKHKLVGGMDAPIYWCVDQLKTVKEGDEVEYSL